MATGPGVNQGKTAFVEKYFASHPDGKLETVNEAWTDAGNEGSVSESLVAKIRSRMGLTGKKEVDEPKPVEASAKPRVRKPANAKKLSKPVEQVPPVANGSRTSAGAAARSGHDDDVLDELEESIDELIQKIRELGGRPDVVKALRRARRLLVRSHEG